MVSFVNDLAVLLMAYGTPSSENEIETYLTNVRRGRKPHPQAVEDLKERYRKIGGRSPLLEITTAQASALEKNLQSEGTKARVYVGMKHWHPYIAEVVPKIVGGGFHRMIALVMAPHYSKMSIDEYKHALENAIEGSTQLHVEFAETWYDNPFFHQAVAEKVNEALGLFPVSGKVEVVFTAHSLPERMLGQNDPYPEQLRASCQAVADLVKIDNWSFAYQSAGRTAEKWLGPDVNEVLAKLGRGRDRFGGNVLIVPIGFVADHLEILYDIDIETQLFAKAQELNLKRTESLNLSPTFISALADIVRRRLN